MFNRFRRIVLFWLWGLNFQHFYKGNNFVTACLLTCSLITFRKESSLTKKNKLTWVANSFLLAPMESRPFFWRDAKKQKNKQTSLTVSHLKVYPFRLQVKFLYCLTLLLLNTTCPVLANSVDPDQLWPTNLDLHYLSLNMWISIKNPDQVICLARS